MQREGRVARLLSPLVLACAACGAPTPRGNARPQSVAGPEPNGRAAQAGQGGEGGGLVAEAAGAAGASAEGGPSAYPGAGRGPAPELPPGEKVRLSDLAAALERIAEGLEREPAVRADFESLRRAHALSDDASLYREYVRVRLVFESVRDGGLWQLRWAITDREANSDAIWSQWARLGGWGGEADRPTATAECDELSALFAFLVRRLGVTRVGLFWPTYNHTVAVWTARGEGGKPVRLVVPTSQIFLGEGDSLGTSNFDPWRQKTVYDYGRRDARDDATVPADLARFFVLRSWQGGGLSQAELQRARNKRSRLLGGS